MGGRWGAHSGKLKAKDVEVTTASIGTSEIEASAVTNTKIADSTIRFAKADAASTIDHAVGTAETEFLHGLGGTPAMYSVVPKGTGANNTYLSTLNAGTIGLTAPSDGTVDVFAWE